jgi:RNA polymerase sigma factor FliA
MTTATCAAPRPVAAAPAVPVSVPASDASTPVTVEELVRSTLPLVGHLVREVLGRVPAHVNRDDLVSAAMYALTVSAQSFDASLGVPFSRFAAIRIRGALTDELRTMDWASRGVRSRARELESVRGELVQVLGRAPSRDEICSAMGLSGSEVAGIEGDVARAAVLSLHALSPEDGAEVLPMRADGPETLLLRREQIGYLRDAIAELPERLRTVVSGYFFEQRKMADIAAELGVTESRISQLRSEALTVLRTAMQSVDEPVAAPIASVRGRKDATRSYCAAVAARSTLAGRLSATTVLCESQTEIAAMVTPVRPQLRLAN